MENKVLAIVNGKEITETDLEFTISRFPQQNQQYFRSEQGRAQLLDQIVSYELVYNFAKDSKLEEEETFKNQLEAVKKDLLIQAGITKSFENAKVTESEIEEFYNKNKAMFQTEETVSAKHILVDSEEEAKNIAEEIKSDKITFEDAAKKYSKCPSKEQGGNLGAFERGRMVPEFEKAAFDLDINTVSEPVKTQFGYHIIKVEEKNESDVKPLEEVKEMVSANLLQEKQNKEFLTLVEKLKETYPVEVK
ncbi:peptidylprolyl isomerase [Clostridium ihumii]|uniref:peptidylprolyl isomerase n=1 Tax=Clostridium ihumii TaxID=1470356 RepID=UPI000559407E|nr:peptidylprolyl isomerase [Clostridium ihumii]